MIQEGGEALPSTVCWFTHRIASSGRYSDSLEAIEERWSLDDALDAHAVLDAVERTQRKAEA